MLPHTNEHKNEINEILSYSENRNKLLELYNTYLLLSDFGQAIYKSVNNMRFIRNFGKHAEYGWAHDEIFIKIILSLSPYLFLSVKPRFACKRDM